MAKLLRVRDRLLLGLAFLGEVFEEVKGGSGIAASAYENLYGFTPSKYKKSNYYATVRRMLSSDLIEKVIEDGEPKYRLSSKGGKTLICDFPLLTLQNKRWDKKWRVLIFDIPEKIRWRRDVFRAKIKEIGFGMAQQSVWVSPNPFEDDIREYIEARKLDSFVYLFISSGDFVGDIDTFIDNVWNIENLNEKYWKLLKDFEKYKGRENELVDVFFELLMKDPFLPRELLPDPWYADEVRLLIRGAVGGRY